mmetsp:Transcript_128005/g.362320  ORF Transcript_128005/g.362320 Transcript_128005/m.362320 type:complete len:96 (+) Transcript_128005:720-1007(+)
MVREDSPVRFEDNDPDSEGRSSAPRRSSGKFKAREGKPPSSGTNESSSSGGKDLEKLLSTIRASASGHHRAVEKNTKHIAWLMGSCEKMERRGGD